MKTFFKSLTFLLTNLSIYSIIFLACDKHDTMREGLSGGAPPCQGGGRGFDPRLALLLYPDFYPGIFILSIATGIS